MSTFIVSFATFFLGIIVGQFLAVLLLAYYTKHENRHGRRVVFGDPNPEDDGEECDQCWES